MMRTKKKNRFFTFCCSLIPGAAEMYMGFMKSGVSLMALFFLVITLAIMLNQGAVAMFGVLIWFYSFFHANHIASLSDEDFREVKDRYLFGMDAVPGIETLVQKYHKLTACVLIFVGSCFLWSSVTDLLYDLLPDDYSYIARIMWKIGDFIPSVLIGLLIIVIGVRMLRGKTIDLDTPEEKTEMHEGAERGGKGDM